MNNYLVQYVFTPTGATIDTIVSAENQRDATRRGRSKIANKLSLSASMAKKSLRWKATTPINKQGRLFVEHCRDMDLPK